MFRHSLLEVYGFVVLDLQRLEFLKAGGILGAVLEKHHPAHLSRLPVLLILQGSTLNIFPLAAGPVGESTMTLPSQLQGSVSDSCSSTLTLSFLLL